MSAADIQALLRFLTKDAKVPLATAMSKVKELQTAQLADPDDIAKSKLENVLSIFQDGKLAKQILSAAKRSSKKRSSDGPSLQATPPAKRRRADPFETPGLTPAHEVEASLALPESQAGEDELQSIVLITNRAPLVLAFAVTLLRYTMPEQPLSSRLSLAQAVVSMNSQSKAKSIGLTSGRTAEDEGWGQGQPTVKVMSREVSVLKRWGYDWKTVVKGADKRQDGQSEEDLKEESGDESQTPALWAIDLEQMKNLNGPLTFNATSTDTAGLPVYSPQAARNYLYRSFEIQPAEPPTATEDIAISPKKPKKRTAAMTAADREKHLGMLLKSLKLLFDSWSETLSQPELDQRAWSWYVKTRPEVEHGVAGWGAKGRIALAEILDLRRKG